MLQRFRNKNISILSDDDFIFEGLCDNAPKFFDDSIKIEVKTSSVLSNIKKYKLQLNDNHYIEIIMNNEFLDKIDILILDKNIQKEVLPIFRSDIIVNFTNFSVSNNEITLSKPFKLYTLLDIIKNHLCYNNNIFCCINKDWIYKEAAATLTSSNENIYLTDKENILFKSLIESDNFKADKDYFLHNIWNYSQGTESSTVDTHLYKLKQKLPQGLLEIKNTYCFLSIEDIT